MAQTATPITDLARERQRMVDVQIAGRGITDRRVLNAMREVPREMFVTEGLEEFAYEDSALPIEAGQTISQPYIVALMIQAADVKRGDRVLDVGTGSGYAAAVLSRIAGRVYTIERHPELADIAEQRFAKLGYHRNIEVRRGDGTLGWPEAVPFDAIIVAAGGPEVPETLRQQLKVGGRLIIPIGTLGREQWLVKVARDGHDAYHEEDLGAVMFVPLVGKHGWPDPSERGGVDKQATEARAPAALARGPAELLHDAAEKLPPLDDPAFGRLFDRVQR